MKTKILAILIVFATMCGTAKAQVYLGGTFSFQINEDNTALLILPQIGYEINDKWAIGGGAGLYRSEQIDYTAANIYARFNLWNNDRFFFDLKAGSQWIFFENNTQNAIGFTPSFRVKANKHLEFAANVGFLGVSKTYSDYEPEFSVTPASTSIEILYKF